nr:uncharacterized protein y4qI-like [Nerophis lumbriciformis]
MKTWTIPDPLPNATDALQALVASQRDHIAELEQQLAWFTEQYRLAQHRRFAAASETCPHQLDLFAALLEEAHQAATAADEAASENSPLGDDDEGNTDDKPKRRRTGRPSLPPDLPRDQVIHDLADDEKICPCCGKPKQAIGDTRSEQLDIEPPKLKVIEHIQLKYACADCTDGGVNTAAKPAQPIPKSNASPALLAYLVVAKVLDGLPLFRLERLFDRLGYKLPRSTQASWLIKSGQLVQPLINLMHDDLVDRDIILADETTFQVLKEPGRAAQTKSYLWCYRSGCGPPIVLFDYTPTRAGQNPKDYLTGFNGYLLTDGYSGYNRVRTAVGQPVMAGCWFHARQNFHHIIKARPKDAEPGLADEALAYANTLFRLERQWKTCSDEQRQQLRQQFSAPVLNQFKTWLERYLTATAPKTLLGKAIRYALRFWTPLTQFLDDGRLPLSNNETEQAIKTFVLGRKAFLFSDTPAGANALANLYSLVQTARANGLEPWAYLKQVFTQLPHAQTVDHIEALLPWRVAEVG